MLNHIKTIRSIIGPMIDAMPHPLFLVDKNVSIMGLNKASLNLVGSKPEYILRKPAGEVLHCLHSGESRLGCGHTLYCKDCTIRKAVSETFKKKSISREKVKMEIVSKNIVSNCCFTITTSPFDYDGTSLVLLQLENLTELMGLQDIIPICASCNDIRINDDSWQKIDYFLANKLNLNLSHSLCPKCLKKLYGNEDWIF